MSADKYPSIFSRQMEAIVYIFSRQMEAIVYITSCCRPRILSYWLDDVKRAARCCLLNLTSKIIEPLGLYPPRPSASVDNTLLDLQNSSYPTQPHSIIVKYRLCVTGVLQLSDVIDQIIFLCMLLRKHFDIITFTRKYINFYSSFLYNFSPFCFFSFVALAPP